MRIFAALIAFAVLMAPSAALAQDFGVVNVPRSGYSGTGTLDADNSYTIFYNITVDAGRVLIFDFRAVGNGTFSVFLSKMDDPLNYYRSFSSPLPVSEFSRTFPADFGYTQDYFLQINSTSEYEVNFTVSIYTEEAPTGNYTIYYILIAVGFIALVIFSYKLVVWQEEREKKDKQNKRRKGKRQK